MKSADMVARDPSGPGARARHTVACTRAPQELGQDLCIASASLK